MIRAVVTAFGGVFAVAALAAVAAEIGQADAAPASFQFLTWLVPIVAGAAAGVLAWLVLDRPPVQPTQPAHSTMLCPACSSPIMDGWRLCPHCGVFVGEEPGSAGGASGTGVAPGVTSVGGMASPAVVTLSAGIAADGATLGN